MAAVVYALCALTALLCAWLLLRAYAAARTRLLWWSGLCFSGLTLTNVLLMLDKLVYTEVDLQPLRLSVTLLSLLLLLYGLLYADE